MPEGNSSSGITDGDNNAITQNHPYHFHLSDSPGMSLINTVFDGKGFPGWRRSVLIALSTKRKLGFINGTCKEPDLASNYYPQCLESRFGKSNGAKLYHLQKELSALVQGNSDISGKGKITKSMQDQRLIQFLMGLSDVYAHATGYGQMQIQRPAGFLPQPYQQKSGNIQFKGKGKRAKFNPNVSCRHCYRIGHVIDDCFRLHGFPEDFEFNKGKNSQNSIRGNAALGYDEIHD
ncbi:uncharacterized protein LOC132617224 [Lycium barbarum]|uniref:uncharacterized protein LOC132617224 n=1 Tax=Lycium barbarum TaxID=112863 RepID=UPI00293E3002|nr:uncharacterized protein LOC132617224 [Lycium barbarum]